MHDQDGNGGVTRGCRTVNSYPDHFAARGRFLETSAREVRVERAAGDFGDCCVRDGRIERLDLERLYNSSNSRARPYEAGDEPQNALESSGAGAVAETAHQVRPT